LFVALRIDRDKSDFRLENNISRLSGMPGTECLYSVLNRSVAKVGPIDGKPHYLPYAHSLPENDIVEGYGHKIVAREFLVYRDIGKLVDPLEHVPPEKVAVMVQVSGEDYFIVFHD
jgi:hypothetical protein